MRTLLVSHRRRVHSLYLSLLVPVFGNALICGWRGASIWTAVGVVSCCAVRLTESPLLLQPEMGAKQSKLVLNGAKTETVATHDETPGICKELNENGTVEAVSGDAAPHQETANSACEGDVSAAPADQSSAVNGEETKVTHKKKNPINWIQKKISMKKPHKAETTEPDKEQKIETPAAEGEEAKTAAPVVPPVEQAPAPKTHEAELQQPPTEETAVESKWINAPSTEACAEISTQAEPILTKDQGAGFGDESTAFEQMVEITPAINGHHHHLMGDAQLGFDEQACQPFEEPVEPATDDLPAETGISEKLANLGIDAAPEQGLTNGHDGATNVEPATDDLPAETGISEKLANLGIDAAPEQGLTNGHDGATNGHCVVTADGETMEEN
ncbi:unnamed protein product [Schistocephalus solidus]|uniref:Fibrous sheath CABYR-binding protein-like n=1 Tax=Schistocephalus solidus TaxID=70667 RepID=A0A183SVX8_SCHSO|nr:unnamed protein product [Schistocephalus solidus]